MWNSIADFVIKYRLWLIIFIALVTVYMGYHASRVEMSYDSGQTVPLDDPEMIELMKFRAQFGEDGNVIAIGVKDSTLYQLEKFKFYQELTREIKKIQGVKQALALPALPIFLKDTAKGKFYSQRIFPDTLKSQSELDSLLTIASNQRIYANQLLNPTNGAALMVVFVPKEVMNSSKREAVASAIQAAGKRFEQRTNIRVHYAGLPFIRTMVANAIRQEMQIFLYASILVTGVIMFAFFRSFKAVLFSMIIIGIVVIWTMGTLVLFGYKITLLSALIPPVIVTLGITNAIYLLNKYHLEFSKTKNKLDAIRSVVRKMGLATFLTNLTVAIGFLTLLSTDVIILREFGIVAGLNIMALFFVSLIMIPGIFSWLPIPTEKHLKHLNFPIMKGFLNMVDLFVHRHRPIIYIGSIVLAVISVLGILQLRSLSFMVDDIPTESEIKRDLTFVEENFNGIMPLEFVIEFHSKRRRPILDVKNLQMIESFENFLDSIDVMAPPLSAISFIKTTKQAFYNNNPARYQLPTRQEGAFILRYMKGETDSSGLSNSFIDSTFSKMRISTRIADIGSRRLDSLVQVIEPRIKEIFMSTKADSVSTSITGTTKIFIKGNKFLIENLRESLLLAFLLITLSMAILFANVRMIIISLLPNLLALMITAGLMGYFNIPLKPSTALIFSITFGISVDNSIRFLAKYRQEILSNNFYIPRAVSDSILETGKSIMYTSIVLFAGFIIFAFSSFGGTIALGVLTSITLVISMFTNLILLPALIMTFDKPKGRKGDLLIDDFDSSFYGESEDEEIDLSRIKIHNRHPSAE